MSRVGKKPITIPKGVKADIKDNMVSVEGPKGKMEYRVPSSLKVSVKDDTVLIEKTQTTKENNALQGLARTIIANLIIGLTEGYAKSLEIKGVGFKAQAQGKILKMSLGFSHPIEVAIPDGIEIKTPKPTQVIVGGIDKVKVGEIAAKIRAYFKAEPYTGKGIRYVGEHVRHKAGKTVTK